MRKYQDSINLFPAIYTVVIKHCHKSVNLLPNICDLYCVFLRTLKKFRSGNSSHIKSNSVLQMTSCQIYIIITILNMLILKILKRILTTSSSSLHLSIYFSQCLPFYLSVSFSWLTLNSLNQSISISLTQPPYFLSPFLSSFICMYQGLALQAFGLPFVSFLTHCKQIKDERKGDKK